MRLELLLCVVFHLHDSNILAQHYNNEQNEWAMNEQYPYYFQNAQENSVDNEPEPEAYYKNPHYENDAKFDWRADNFRGKKELKNITLIAYMKPNEDENGTRFSRIAYLAENPQGGFVAITDEIPEKEYLERTANGTRGVYAFRQIVYGKPFELKGRRVVPFGLIEFNGVNSFKVDAKYKTEENYTASFAHMTKNYTHVIYQTPVTVNKVVLIPITLTKAGSKGAETFLNAYIPEEEYLSMAHSKIHKGRRSGRLIMFGDPVETGGTTKVPVEEILYGVYGPEEVVKKQISLSQYDAILSNTGKVRNETQEQYWRPDLDDINSMVPYQRYDFGSNGIKRILKDNISRYDFLTRVGHLIPGTATTRFVYELPATSDGRRMRKVRKVRNTNQAITVQIANMSEAMYQEKRNPLKKLLSQGAKISESEGQSAKHFFTGLGDKGNDKMKWKVTIRPLKKDDQDIVIVEMEGNEEVGNYTEVQKHIFYDEEFKAYFPRYDGTPGYFKIEPIMEKVKFVTEVPLSTINAFHSNALKNQKVALEKKKALKETKETHEQENTDYGSVNDMRSQGRSSVKDNTGSNVNSFSDYNAKEELLNKENHFGSLKSLKSLPNRIENSANQASRSFSSVRPQIPASLSPPITGNIPGYPPGRFQNNDHMMQPVSPYLSNRNDRGGKINSFMNGKPIVAPNGGFLYGEKGTNMRGPNDGYYNNAMYGPSADGVHGYLNNGWGGNIGRGSYLGTIPGNTAPGARTDRNLAWNAREQFNRRL